jgi:deoxyribodipyrimidine photolyase-related protein
MNSINIIWPHQLYKNNPLVTTEADCILVEVDLFFTQYKFHQQKIAFHRASMQAYAERISSEVNSLRYIDAHDELSAVDQLMAQLADEGINQINTIDSTDNWLERRIKRACEKHEIKRICKDSRLFLSPLNKIADFFRPDKNSYFHHQFYQQQRKRLNILMTEDNKPVGGQWSFDEDNRKKYPKDKTPPEISWPEDNETYQQANDYVKTHFNDHLGELNTTADSSFRYPITHEAAEQWFDEFLKTRFHTFGDYEDAVVKNQLILHHSVITPMLNVGLLCPQWVVQRALSYAKEHDVPINSLEGFIRQIIGWREFMRGLYETHGSAERTTNYWQFKRPIPTAFYTGETGIEPIDITIKKVLETGYCHHIERLMLLGNFMLLCEFDPDAVYQWFMELFIDAYDWVMVPNVYGMSQFADGGLMATKPYISSSNYVLKMSDYPGGKKSEAWRSTWDGLFWHFMYKQRSFFESNPRIGMLLKTWDRMDEVKQKKHLEIAKKFLSQLNQ